MKKLKIYLLLALVTIALIIGCVKLYKRYGRSVVYQYSLGAEMVKAFADSDISLHTPVTCSSKVPGNVWLISYASGDKWLMNQNAQATSGVNKCIDTIRIYREKDISPEYFEAHKEILSAKRGGGYWLWKPYLILKTLNEMPENDILIYLDSGAKVVNPVDSFVDNLLEKDIVVFVQDSINKTYARKKLFQIMDMDNEVAWSSKQADASRILLRNTKVAREFIAEWLRIGEMPGAISDSDKTDEYPEFIDHRHDQSILSLLYIKYPEKVHIFQGSDIPYFFHHRRYDFSSVSLVFDHAPLTEFESWLSKAAYKVLQMKNAQRE